MDCMDNLKSDIVAIFEPTEIDKREKGEASLFFKLNNIEKVFKLVKGEQEIDLVFTITSPLDVILSFDLTFCQNWFDGKDLFYLYKEHVESKNGYLNKNYINLFFSGNIVTINRILKYIKRKYIVKIPEIELNYDLDDCL